MTPFEALEALIWQGSLMAGSRREPGGMVKHATAEMREALKRLTSADVANIRRDNIHIQCSR